MPCAPCPCSYIPLDQALQELDSLEELLEAQVQEALEAQGRGEQAQGQGEEAQGGEPGGKPGAPTAEQTHEGGRGEGEEGGGATAVGLTTA